MTLTEMRKSAVAERPRDAVSLKSFLRSLKSLRIICNYTVEWRELLLVFHCIVFYVVLF